MRAFRPLVAAAITVGVYVAAEVVRGAAQGDIVRLAKKYPLLATDETIKNFVGGIPLVGGVINFFAGPVLDKASQVGMSPEDAHQLELDHEIVTFAPFVGAAALILGVPLTMYLVWKDLIQTPVDAARLQELRLAGIGATGQAAGVALPAVVTGGASVPVQAATGIVKETPNPGRMRLYEVVHNEKRAEEVASALSNLPEHAFSEIEIKPRGKEWAVWVEEPD